MIEDNILSAIEALLFISNEPLTLDSIAEILEIDEEKTKEAILHLKREYEKTTQEEYKYRRSWWLPPLNKG